MLSMLSSWLGQVSTGKVALVATVVFLLFMGFVLPRQAESASAASGVAGSPDTSFLYSAQDLYRIAEAYGETGRAAYVRARMTFDLVFPLVYGLFLTTTISWLCSRAFRPESPWRQTNLVPLGAMLFDFLENLAASLVMIRYPDSTPVLDTVAPIFTLFKWILVSASFVLLVLIGVTAAARLRGARRKLT